jgi:hypothetical protein
MRKLISRVAYLKNCQYTIVYQKTLTFHLLFILQIEGMQHTDEYFIIFQAPVTIRQLPLICR